MGQGSQTAEVRDQKNVFLRAIHGSCGGMEVLKKERQTDRSSSKLPILFVTVLKIKNVKGPQFWLLHAWFLLSSSWINDFILPAITVLDLQE